MRVLVTWGSKLGGTAGIAQIVAETLRAEGFDVVAAPARAVRDVAGFDAAIVGGALYANRWHRDARRFVARNVGALRRIPVWMFSSGPLDDSADHRELPPPTQVAVLGERAGAIGHVTFGGRLAPDAKGFAAQAMAKTLSGDWRNPERIRAWASDVARKLPAARPDPAIDPPGRRPWRVVAHASVGWMLCAIVMLGLLRIGSPSLALVLHAMAAPLIFVGVAVHYFRKRGAREPLATALTITGIVAVLDTILIAALARRGLAVFTGFAGIGLPIVLIFVATWVTGFFVSTMPWPKPQPRASAA